MPQSIVFLGSKPIGYECLKYLLEKQHVLNVEIIAIGTKARQDFSGQSDLTLLAKEYNITLINHPDEIPECDIICSVQYHKILKQQHIDQARQIAINLHLAALPEYRGCNQFSFALFDNAAEFGVTIHAIDTGIDHGDILFEKRFEVPKQCWVDKLYELAVKHGIDLFQEKISAVVAGQYNPIPQAALEPLKGTQTHYRKEIEDLKQIRLDDDLEITERRIRATMMPGFEPPYYIENGKKVYYGQNPGKL